MGRIPQEHARKGLPLRGSPAAAPRTHRRIIIAHHLVLTGYGFWLPNDVRVSGSTEVRKDALRDLAPIHHGRKKDQPTRDELKAFYLKANPKLEFEPLWFDSAKRQAISDTFARVIADFRYTVWACAILRNHAHVLVRRHRDDHLTIFDTFRGASRESLRHFEDNEPEHPIWSDRPYTVFVYDPAEVRTEIDYINKNPAKENLPPQRWSFVLPYDGWPQIERRGR